MQNFHDREYTLKVTEVKLVSVRVVLVEPFRGDKDKSRKVSHVGHFVSQETRKPIVERPSSAKYVSRAA
jgi:hypothetical protein